MFFLLSVFLSFSILFYCSRKYNNPYKLTYIFGKKGAGKSTYMVMLMLRYLRRGWNVYCNMQDVKIPGVRIFDALQLKDHTPMPHSVVFIDEAGLIWDNRGFKSFDSGFTEWYKYQRKYGCRVYINSQSYDVDKKIRDLVDSMVLMTNICNCIGVIRPIVRKIGLVEASAQAESRVAENLKFAPIWDIRFIWLPAYFRWFDSFAAPRRPQVYFRQVSGLLPSRSDLALTQLRNIQRRFRK